MKRKTYISLLIFILILVSLWVLAGWNTNNYDYDNYSRRYGYILDGGFNPLVLDFGYDFIEYVFGLMGLTYQQFRIWIYGICLLVIGSLVWKWSIHPIMVLLFYVCFHFLRDVVETRNFIASIFILLTLGYYGRSKPKLFIILLLILLGFSVHMVFFLYIPFVLIDLKHFHYWWLFVISIVLSFFARNFLGDSLFFLAFEGLDDKVDRILSDSATFAFIASACSALGNGVCISYFHNKVMKADLSKISINHLSVNQYSWVMYNMNALTCLLLILTPINSSFYTRLFGNIVILNVIYFTNVISWVKKDKALMIIMVIVYASYFIVMDNIQPFMEHLNYVLNNNSLLFR